MVVCNIIVTNAIQTPKAMGATSKEESTYRPLNALEYVHAMFLDIYTMLSSIMN